MVSPWKWIEECSSGPGMVFQACNPNYRVGGEWEVLSWRSDCCGVPMVPATWKAISRLIIIQTSPGQKHETLSST
jgi:hypothetical protein